MAWHLLHDHLGRPPHGLRLRFTSETPGFEARNLETGTLHDVWQAGDTGLQRLWYDAGPGATVSVDYLALAYLHLLVALSATITPVWSDNGETGWTSVGGIFPLTLTPSHLLAPTGQHGLFELPATTTKRAIGLEIAGGLAAPARLAGWQLGLKTVLPAGPRYGRSVGLARPHLGAPVVGEWGPFQTVAAALAWRAALVAVTPTHPLEVVSPSLAGHPYGGLAHYLADLTGGAFPESDVPMLLPVVCMTPQAAVLTSLAKLIEQGATVEWRQLV